MAFQEKQCMALEENGPPALEGWVFKLKSVCEVERSQPWQDQEADEP